MSWCEEETRDDESPREAGSAGELSRVAQSTLLPVCGVGLPPHVSVTSDLKVSLAHALLLGVCVRMSFLLTAPRVSQRCLRRTGPT